MLKRKTKKTTNTHRKQYSQQIQAIITNKQRQCKQGYIYPKVLLFKVLTNVQHGTSVENPKFKFHESICIYAIVCLQKCTNDQMCILSTGNERHQTYKGKKDNGLKSAYKNFTKFV